MLCTRIRLCLEVEGLFLAYLFYLDTILFGERNVGFGILEEAWNGWIQVFNVTGYSQPGRVASRVSLHAGWCKIRTFVPKKNRIFSAKAKTCKI